MVEKGGLEARLNTLCRAYGVPVKVVLNHVPSYLQMVARDIRALAATGTEPFVAFVEGGIPEGLEKDLDYCLQTWL